MNEQKRFPLWIIFVGAGCVGILCLGVLAAGGAYFFLNQRTSLPATLSPKVTVQVDVVEPTSISVQTAEPTPVEPVLVEPTTSAVDLTGDQYVSEYSLMDDFSSDALGWPIFDDGKTIIQYADQAYNFQIKEANFYDWAYFPVDFVPYEIWFDVRGVAGPQDGTFGVFCQFQDADNYYYVEFDLEENTYLIGQILNGDEIHLTEQNESGDYWQSTDALYSPPESANRIGLSCYLDSLTLFINDEWVADTSISQPFSQPGEAAFFVYAFDSAGENGYQVFFDNVEAYQPIQ